MLHRIPPELRALNQWVCAGPDKIPLNPRTGAPADVTDPATWGTFDEAAHCGYRHVGFVLSTADPYCIIDLDAPINEEQAARHTAILTAFQTYSELSQSGQGMHIVCRASVPHGVRRDKVEIYSSGRYMIFTGHVWSDLPIADAQALVTPMFEQMNAHQPVTDLVQTDGDEPDAAILVRAASAANGDKFNKLWGGAWDKDYPSQSEADFALLSIIAFYTKDNEQVRRIFRSGPLGQREKATRNDKYLDFALSKIRAKEPAPLDFSLLLQRAERITRPPEPAPIVVKEPDADEPADLPPPADEDTAWPPGLIGELADYIHASAIRPVREIAVVAAIGLTAGVIGRTFNISGSGLNQYLILLAKTGSGKDGMTTGIDSLVAAVRPQVPMVDDFIGPSVFASGQALVRVLDKQECFMSVLGEFGFTLQEICSPKASSANLTLKRVMLDIYTRSGFNKVLRPSVYSETEKNTRVVQAPNVTILGESTPEIFYDGLDATAIAQGLIPRFSVFEYLGPRPPRNPHAFCPPPPALVDKFASLVTIALVAKQNRAVCPVQVNPDALALLDAFDRSADKAINATGADVIMQLWNRAHLKALKLSALLAAGCNPHQPIVEAEHAAWAISLVQRDISRLAAKFSAGDTGQGDTRMESDLRRAAADWLRMRPPARRDYGCPDRILSEPVIPLGFLRRRLRPLTAFRTHPRGANAALAGIIKAMVEAGELAQVPVTQASASYGVSTPLYAIGPAWD